MQYVFWTPCEWTYGCYKSVMHSVSALQLPVKLHTTEDAPTCWGLTNPSRTDAHFEDGHFEELGRACHIDTQRLEVSQTGRNAPSLFVG